MKKTAEEILITDKKDKWTILEKRHTSFLVSCNKCGKEQTVSKYMIQNDKDECFCSSNKGKKMARKEAMKLFHYITDEAYRGYGMLEGQELVDYIYDVLRIESPIIASNKIFCEMVVEEMYEIYEERKVQRCVNCRKLYPASRMYKKACLKKFKATCVA